MNRQQRIAKLKSLFQERIVVMDGPRESIYGDRESRVAWLNGLMSGLCAEAGVAFVDLTADMKLDYQKHQRKFNSEIDWHWNEYGHDFVARKMATVVTESIGSSHEGGHTAESPRLDGVDK